MRNPFSKTYEPNDLRMFDFLQGIKFFELLKQQELARFLPTMHERKYVRDEVVFFSKDPSQALYLIRKGQVHHTGAARQRRQLLITPVPTGLDHGRAHEEDQWYPALQYLFDVRGRLPLGFDIS